MLIWIYFSVAICHAFIIEVSLKKPIEIWATSWENLFMVHANEKAQISLRISLTNAFVIRCLDSIIPLLAISEISSL